MLQSATPLSSANFTRGGESHFCVGGYLPNGEDGFTLEHVLSDTESEDRMIEKCKRKVVRTQGKENAFWVILDYGDIVANVFQTPYRAFYRLEDLWADADREEYTD